MMSARTGMTLVEIVCTLVILAFVAMAAMTLSGYVQVRSAKAPLVARDHGEDVSGAESVVTLFASLVNDDSVPRDEVLGRLLASLPEGSVGKWVAVSGNALSETGSPSDTLLVVTRTGRATPVRNIFCVNRSGAGSPKVGY